MDSKLKDFGLDTPEGIAWANRKRRTFLLERLKRLDIKRAKAQESLSGLNQDEHALVVHQMQEYEKERKAINIEIAHIERPQHHSNLSDSEIEQARLADIKQFLTTEPNRSNKINCLLHDDNNPSMHVYKNNLFCFSCGGSLDTIGLVMMNKNMDFVEAVKFINRS